MFVEIDAKLIRDAIDIILGDDVEKTLLSRVFIRELIQECKETDLDCDHSVGICACGDRATVEELKLVLEGMKWCPSCGGNGCGGTSYKSLEDR